MRERERARWGGAFSNVEGWGGGGLLALIVLNNSADLKTVKTAIALPYSLRVQARAPLLYARLMGVHGCGEGNVCVLVAALQPASSSSGGGSLSIKRSCT